MIGIGSRVNVYWENLPAELNVVVASNPNSPSADWIFFRDDGAVIVVKSFCKIEEIKSEDE